MSLNLEEQIRELVIREYVANHSIPDFVAVVGVTK